MATRAKKKRQKRIPVCPQCQSTQVVPIVHGLPNAAQSKAIKLGRAIIADREEWEGMSEWFCQSCGSDWSRHSRRFKMPGGVNATKAD